MIRLFAGAPLLFLGLLFCACSPEPPARPAQLIDEKAARIAFGDRSVDLRDHLEGFPFSQFLLSADAGRIFYFSHDERMYWKAVPFGRQPDLWRGEPISELDFAGRSVWSIAYDAKADHLYWLGDEEGDEHINLWRLAPGKGAPERLTDLPYIYGWSREPGGQRIAYTARQEGGGGALYLLHLQDGREELIADDRPDLRFTYGRPSWRPDGRGLVVSVLRGGDRRYGALLYLDLKSGERQLLTDTLRPAIFPRAYGRWLSNDECLYLSDQDGYTNAYSYHFGAGRNRRLTHFNADISLLHLLHLQGRPRLLTVAGLPGAYELALTVLPSGRMVWRQALDGPLDLYHSQGDHLLVGRPAPDRPLRIDELSVTEQGAGFRPFLYVPSRQRERMIHAEAKRLRLPTFDTDPASGRPRSLHAYLYEPRQPLPPGQGLLLVEAFYGGGQRYRTDYQLLAAAGSYVLSPAPRGSAGFGRAFAALNDGDLGGDETVDLIYLARHVADSLGIPPERTGLFGSSHGGYAVLRGLTWPDTVNGRAAWFPWGFGMAHAAFSDLEALYQRGNVQAWVRAEAGDPASAADRLRARSPIYYANRLQSPLLLTHGSTDQRAPIGDIRRFVDTLRRFNRPVTLVELEGQGHPVKGLAAQQLQYRAWLDFLRQVIKTNSAAPPGDPAPGATPE